MKLSLKAFICALWICDLAVGAVFSSASRVRKSPIERRLNDKAATINAQTTLFNPEKQKQLYELRRREMEQMDTIGEDLNHMEVNLSSLRDMVKTRIEQMHQILDSNLNENKVFKVTVDNLKF